MSGVFDVGACDILEKVESPDGSTIVEVEIKIGGCSIASEDLCRKRHHLSCCHFWRKENLVEYVLNYLLRDIFLSMFQALNTYSGGISYVSLVISI